MFHLDPKIGGTFFSAAVVEFMTDEKIRAGMDSFPCKKACCCAACGRLHVSSACTFCARWPSGCKALKSRLLVACRMPCQRLYLAGLSLTVSDPSGADPVYGGTMATFSSWYILRSGPRLRAGSPCFARRQRVRQRLAKQRADCSEQCAAALFGSTIYFYFTPAFWWYSGTSAVLQ